MRVRDEIRKTVAFIGYEDKQNGNFVPVGSIFFLGHDSKDGADKSPRVYVVTARHVIDGLRGKGVTHAVVRLNAKTNEPPSLSVYLPNQSDEISTHLSRALTLQYLKWASLQMLIIWSFR
jgi:hypothetical protein